MNADLFTERRSVGSFDASQPLDKEKLKAIVELASNTPSAFNLEPWRVIAVESEEAKERLFEKANRQPKIKEATYNLIIIGDREGYSPENPAWEELKGLAGEAGAEGAMKAAARLYGSSEERKIKFAESNGGLLAMSLMYAAQAYGVDSHPMSGIDFEGIAREFSLKEGEHVVMVIALGYRDTSTALRPWRRRKSYEALVEEV
ncbi:MAG: nitroreductase family protein [Spirochaetales bacterium]|nr:nitroreductase family protein [Spirochaetales bacterium]